MLVGVRLRTVALLVAVLAVLLRSPRSQAQNKFAQPPKGTTLNGHRDFDLAASQQWLDTAISLQPGDTVLITATGSLQYAQSAASGPDGLARGWRDLIRVLPVRDAQRGSLIGRIGDDEAAIPFAIGARREVKAGRAGKLFLGINQPSDETGEGTFHVRVEAIQVSTDPAPAPKTDLKLPDLTEAFAKLPKRVNDKDGNAGDSVNFLIIGPQDRMEQAFANAGWVIVDKSTKDAVLHGLVASLSKEAYVQMPMSELMLFGRNQDYGFAHAEPIKVITTRHHLRLWKAPFEVAGQTLWVGAGTHDIGIEKDQRNGKLTHKIDPAIDGERDYIGQSLSGTGLVAKMDYVTPPNPITEAKTATGGTYHSDGRILVLLLSAASSSDRSGPFAGLFWMPQKEDPLAYRSRR